MQGGGFAAAIPRHCLCEEPGMLSGVAPTALGLCLGLAYEGLELAQIVRMEN